MKPKQTFIYGCSILALSLCSAIAQENPQRGPGPRGFGGGPGRIADLLKRADADGDGKITKDEYLANAKKEAEERFSKMDGNDDGVVDDKEIEAINSRLREMGGGLRRNRDGDGGVRTPAEGQRPDGPRPEGQRPDGPRREREGSRPGGPRPDGPEGGPKGGPPRGPALEQQFANVDKNSDGSVDKEEYEAFAKQESDKRYADMDENGDGKVSKEEFRAFLERTRNRMRQGGPPPGGPGSPPPGGEGRFRRPPEDGGRPEGTRPPPPREGDAPAKKDAA